MSLSQILAILLRRAWIVMLTLLSTIMTVGAVLQLAPGRFEAHATARIDPARPDPVSNKLMRGDPTIMQGNIISLVASHRVAMEVVKRLNWTNDPQTQQVLADVLLTNVEPTFDVGSNVLDITFKARDPSQAALVANTFLAATLDASVERAIASHDEAARWFAPQLDESRKELEEAHAALRAFQVKANMVAPSQYSDSDKETDQYMAIARELTNARSGLTALQSRLTSGSTDLSNDPLDPNLQILSGLKGKLSTAEAETASAKGMLGSNNPKMLAQQANIATLHKQIADATEKMHAHLKDRIGTVQTQIASLEQEQDQAQKSLIAVQAQRDQLAQLQRNVDFQAQQLNAREKAVEAAKLKSKLTFSPMTVLDKAAPPIEPAFPKPFVAWPVGIAGGLALGLILALLAEASDQRVRFPPDLGSGPFLGALEGTRRSMRRKIAAPTRSLASP